MDILFFAILTIGLPVLGVIINLIAVQRYFEPAFNKMKFEDVNWEKKASEIKAKINVLRMMPVTGVIFGALIFQLFLFSEYKLPIEVEEKILLSSGLAVGFSALFMCIGMALMFKEAVPKIVEDQSTFGKYLVLSQISITTTIFGLLISILLFMGLGIIGGTPEVTINLDEANMIFNAFLIFTILSSCTVLKGYLPTLVKGDMSFSDEDAYKKRAKGGWLSSAQPDVQPDPIFSKKLIYAVIPETPIMIGLLIVILTFVEIGLL